MWRPPERIKHHLLDGGWPTAEAAARSRLFSPLVEGRLKLTSRTWVPAMVPWRATDSGFVTDEVVEWYRRFAMGRPGAIVVEATGVRDVPSGPLLRIGDDRFVEGLARIVQAVREASEGTTRLFVQLIDFLAIRRRPDPARYFERFLTVTDRHREALPQCQGDESAIREHLRAADDRELERVLAARELDDLRLGFRERVTDVERTHIRDLPRELPRVFAAAAVRAEQAGFDGVELHYAHAYTMASFLSALNARADGYGGTVQARVRLPLEVHAAVRAAVGDAFVVGCRFLSEDCVPGGSGLHDTTAFGVAFARAGFDFLSLSRGGRFEDAAQPKVGEAVYPYTGPSGWECMPTVIGDRAGPFGRNVLAARTIRSAVRAAGRRTPVVVAGGIHAFAQAESLLESEAADIVGAARQSLADPDWFRKVRLGRGELVRRCTFTNYCEGLDRMHKPVTCKLWDRQDLDEPGVRLTPDRRRRTVAPAWRPEARATGGGHE